jgi:quinol-cytochrome oxidoreductase complex cytochrome b subunit
LAAKGDSTDTTLPFFVPVWNFFFSYELIQAAFKKDTGCALFLRRRANP